MACFQHVSRELQTIYRDLTRSSKHPLGGNAYLSLDDTEVCYAASSTLNCSKLHAPAYATVVDTS
jgi:structural maintenance of chromosome 1